MWTGVCKQVSTCGMCGIVCAMRGKGVAAVPVP